MKKNFAKHAFHRAAGTYDAHATLQKQVAAQLAHMISTVPAPALIYEIGCGSGFLTELLHISHPKTLYIATDITFSMTDQTRKKLTSSQNSPVHYATADGEHPPFSLLPANSWIVSSLVFQWFDTLEKSIYHLSHTSDVLAFSIILDGTFKEWIAMCTQKNMRPGVHSFPTIDQLKTMTASLPDREISIWYEEKIMYFSTIREFLMYLKKTGTHSPQVGYVSLPIFTLLKDFPSMITITYVIGYCIIRKKKGNNVL